MIVGASCTAELIQDDPGGMAETMGLPVPGRSRWNCRPTSARKTSARTRRSSRSSARWRKPMEKTAQVTANLIGPDRAGLPPPRRHHRGDGLLYEMGIGVNVWRLSAPRPRISPGWARRMSTC
jgi:light-independent protochlorophyllide reductase subunit B